MSATSNGGPEPPSDRETAAVGEEPAIPSTSDFDSAGLMGFGTAGSAEEAARVSLADADKLVETRVSDNMYESRVFKLDNEESRVGDASVGAPQNQPSSPVSGGYGNHNKKKVKSEQKKVKHAVEDYDSILSEFDQFAAKGGGEPVGYGYEIGDMVWGKVKSHPWWPGHIYNEAFASPSVKRSKREGHVLVAFFGDSSYGWFNLAELVPFEENFAEKSRQTTARAFVAAVDEALDELSRRQCLGLSCRCRNEFNFWPSSVKDYLVVDVGDYEPGVYSLSQINKSRESFRPKETLSFVQQLALSPKTDQCRTVEFVKKKAIVLACRKALFEEFDETYAQAFGTEPVRPSRPTAPMAVDPARAPLSGRMVIAETLGNGKSSVKPTKPKNQMAKDKYLFKRRDEPIQMKTKKKSSGQVGLYASPLMIDGSGLSGLPMNSSIKGHMHQNYAPGVNDNDRQYQPSNDQAPMISNIRPAQGPRKLVEGGMKKAKVPKQYTGELSADNATLAVKKKRKKDISTERPAGELVQVKKRKKEIRSEAISAEVVQSHLANSDNVAAGEKVSGVGIDVPLTAATNQLNSQKNGEVDSSSSTVEAQQSVDFGKFELTMLVRDLRALSLNPFHGTERNCPSLTRLVFLKFRALVYQKSLVLSPQSENETAEAYSTSLPASTAPHKSNDKSTTKLMRPSARPDDPTRGGKKHDPSDRPEDSKKKRNLDDSVDINKRKKKKLILSEDIKKKKKILDESKLSAVDRKNPQRPTESQRADVKEIAPKKLPSLLKAAKLEASKREQQPGRAPNPNPTMLVMKFPSGAALPSSAELRAKFARFGPLDHSATRVFWKSYTCRLVYQKKVDAEDALKFALGSSNLFGNTNVRSYIREVGADAVDSEPVKAQKEEAATTFGQKTALKIAMQQHTSSLQQSLQLKSCLKKPSAEESGNGNGRGTRVKFVLGGEESAKTEHVSSFAEAGSSSSYTHSHSMDIGSKILPNFIPQPIVAPPPPPPPLPTTSTTHHHHHHHHIPKMAINMPLSQPQQMPSAPKNDISQQLLVLLTRCSDVVNNLTGVLGYVPYHSL